MKYDNFNKRFDERFGVEIESITDEVFKYFPEIKNWQLNNGINCDKDIKFLSKPIYDTVNCLIGHKVNVDIISLSLKYRLIYKKDSFEYLKTSKNNNEVYQEYYKIVLNGDIYRKIYLNKKNNEYIKYKIIDDVYTFNDPDYNLIKTDKIKILKR